MPDLLMKVLGIGENGGPVAGESPRTRLQLAAGVVLLSAVMEDPLPMDDMPGLVLGALLTSFPLPQEYMEALIKVTTPGNAAGLNIHLLKQHINQQYRHEDKVDMLETAWRVIYQSRQLKKIEEYFADKLASYIWVDENDFREAWERGKKGSV